MVGLRLVRVVVVGIVVEVGGRGKARVVGLWVVERCGGGVM